MRTGRRYLVCINTLIDDRIGWVKTTHPAALEQLDLDVYRGRHTELWAENVGIPNWTEHYRGRDKRALMNGTPTEFILALKSMILDDLTQIQMSSPIERPTLTINLWPYTDLTGGEHQSFLNNFRQLYHEVQVELITTPLARFNLGYLNMGWDIWYMYDWFEWLRAMTEAKDFGGRHPAFTIIKPALLTDELTPEIIETIKNDGVNPFKALTRFMEELVTVDTVDCRLFSIIRPRPPEDAEKTPSP